MRMPSNLLLLMGPTILLVFTFSFLLLWAFEKKQRYLLYFAASSLFFCLGALSQLFRFPSDVGFNAITSSILYTASAIFMCDGLLIRNGNRINTLYYIAFMTIIIGGISYFYYVQPNLLVRVYILNFGFGVILLLTAFHLRNFISGKAAEKILFWIFLFFSLHFFPRTIVTTSNNALRNVEFAKSEFWLVLHFSMAVLGVALALALLGLTVSDLLDTVKKERASDSLTGLLNRRGLEEITELSFANPTSWPIQVMLIDIDHFKNINDNYGHVVGDKVLSTIGKVILSLFDTKAICARLGGEEFLIILPDCKQAEGQNLANELRTKIASTNFHELPHKHNVTVSIGLISAKKQEKLLSMINRADIALYQAKKSGRDQVIAA